jgi:hypothetical protein
VGVQGPAALVGDRLFQIGEDLGAVRVVVELRLSAIAIGADRVVRVSSNWQAWPFRLIVTTFCMANVPTG